MCRLTGMWNRLRGFGLALNCGRDTYYYGRLLLLLFVEPIRFGSVSPLPPPSWNSFIRSFIHSFRRFVTHGVGDASEKREREIIVKEQTTTVKQSCGKEGEGGPHVCRFNTIQIDFVWGEGGKEGRRSCYYEHLFISEKKTGGFFFFKVRIFVARQRTRFRNCTSWSCVEYRRRRRRQTTNDNDKHHPVNTR